jgi:hypothetical protein
VLQLEEMLDDALNLAAHGIQVAAAQALDLRRRLCGLPSARARAGRKRHAGRARRPRW